MKLDFTTANGKVTTEVSVPPVTQKRVVKRHVEKRLDPSDPLGWTLEYCIQDTLRGFEPPPFTPERVRIVYPVVVYPSGM
jgi:hypothetical protein